MTDELIPEVESAYWSQWRMRWLPRVATLIAVWMVFQIVDLSWGDMWRWKRDYAWRHHHPEYFTKCDADQ
jgi:hypothetical protein